MRLKVVDAAYSAAFESLHMARVFGHAAPNPISVSEIAAYCSLHGIASAEERSKYLRLIQRLDQVFLAHWVKQNPSTTPTGAGKNNKKS